MKKKCICILILAVILVLFGSCSNNSDGINLVVIVGNRANSHSLDHDDMMLIREMVLQSFDSDGRNARVRSWFVVSDGSPSVRDMGSLSVSANNASLLNTRKDALMIQTIMPFLESENFWAQSEEADLLAAMRLATDIIRNNEPKKRENHILIIDSGITTSGALNLRTIDLREDTVDAIIDDLHRRGYIPDMSGINVTFTNIGNAAYPQRLPQDNHFRNQLLALWGTVLFHADAELTRPLVWSVPGNNPNVHISGDFEDEGEGEGKTGFPFVTTIQFMPPPIPDPDDLPNNGNVIVNPIPLPPPIEVFGTVELGFMANSDRFRDDDNARAALRRYLEIENNMLLYLSENPTSILYIVGSEARMHPHQPNRSSGIYAAMRADRVSSMLSVYFGIPENQLEAVHAGTTVFSWRNANEHPYGDFCGTQATLNRVVAIIPNSTMEFNELVANGFVTP